MKPGLYVCLDVICKFIYILCNSLKGAFIRQNHLHYKTGCWQEKNVFTVYTQHEIGDLSIQTLALDGLTLLHYYY